MDKPTYIGRYDSYLHVAVLAARSVPGEPHGVGLRVGHAEFAHAHRRAQHRALQRAAARHRLVLAQSHPLPQGSSQYNCSFDRLLQKQIWN